MIAHFVAPLITMRSRAEKPWPIVASGAFAVVFKRIPSWGVGPAGRTLHHIATLSG